MSLCYLPLVSAAAPSLNWSPRTGASAVVVVMTGVVVVPPGVLTVVRIALMMVSTSKGPAEAIPVF